MLLTGCFLVERKLKELALRIETVARQCSQAKKKSSCLHFTDGAKLSVKLKSLWTFLISY